MKSKVLVVDDDIAILRLIKNVLESKNFVVDTRLLFLKLISVILSAMI